VVLSYGFWKDNFGGDPSIIGKQMKVSNAIVTVVGVAPPNFRGVWPGSETKLYFPVQQAVGQYVRSTDEKRFPQPVTCRVVGLAQDAKFANLHEPPPRTIYFPVQLETLRNTNLVFLLNAPTKAQAIAAYRKAKSELSPATPFVIFVTLREQMEAALAASVPFR
jgi:hypothetical protein